MALESLLEGKLNGLIQGGIWGVEKIELFSQWSVEAQNCTSEALKSPHLYELCDMFILKITEHSSKVGARFSELVEFDGISGLLLHFWTSEVQGVPKNVNNFNDL